MQAKSLEIKSLNKSRCSNWENNLNRPSVSASRWIFGMEDGHVLAANFNIILALCVVECRLEHFRAGI